VSTSRFAPLIERAKRSDDYWKRGATFGFINGIDRLLRQRKKRRSYLAKKAEMDESTVSRALSGKQNLTSSTMVKMAEAVGAAVYIHVESKEVVGGWVPMNEMVSPATRVEVTSLKDASAEGPTFDVRFPTSGALGSVH